MAKIGFIGLGNMGLPMAQNLVKAGHSVKGFDVTKTQIEALVSSGGAAAANVKAAAGGVDMAITMLPAGQHVRDVYLGAQGVEPSQTQDVRAFLDRERAKFGRVVRELAIAMD